MMVMSGGTPENKGGLMRRKQDRCTRTSQGNGAKDTARKPSEHKYNEAEMIGP